MIDKTIIDDTKLLDQAKTIKRQQVREYNREWRRRFKAEHGISYDLYITAKQIKEGHK